MWPASLAGRAGKDAAVASGATAAPVVLAECARNWRDGTGDTLMPTSSADARLRAIVAQAF